MNETLVAQDYRQLVEQFGSPLLLLDKAAVRKQYRALAAALPDVRLHYALKPLPHEAVVSVLKEEGGLFRSGHQWRSGSGAQPRGSPGTLHPYPSHQA